MTYLLHAGGYPASERKILLFFTDLVSMKCVEEQNIEMKGGRG
jgi:hypothetical protein